MKKVCLLIPSLQAGGMERVMSELIHYFSSKSNYQVHVILYGIKRDIFYVLPSNIVIHKPNFDFNNAKRSWSTFKTLLFLRAEVKALKPDAILSFGELWNSFVLLACLGLKYPIFVSDRCQPDKSLGTFHNSLRRLLYPKAAGVICQTETALRIYKSKFTNRNFLVIPNPIRLIESNSEVKRDNIILTVGRLIKTKHHDELIRIFAEINPPNWQLVIVGDDALKQKNKDKLMILAKDLGVGDRVELVGQQTNVDLFYRKAKIFAFASSSEGFPNVIGEAMSAELPVVAYDCIAGPSDLIEHNSSGYLVPLHDTVSFKKYLLELMNNESLRKQLGKQARIRANEFSVDNVAMQFENALISENTTN